MTKLEFSKPEMDIIKSKIYLTDIQEQILDEKLKGNLTEIGIAYKLNISPSTVTYQWNKVKDKILKVI